MEYKRILPLLFTRFSLDILIESGHNFITFVVDNLSSMDKSFYYLYTVILLFKCKRQG